MYISIGFVIGFLIGAYFTKIVIKDLKEFDNMRNKYGASKYK
jgi:hypothetical protein